MTRWLDKLDAVVKRQQPVSILYFLEAVQVRRSVPDNEWRSDSERRGF
jgi:hypothetical protein